MSSRRSNDDRRLKKRGRGSYTLDGEKVPSVTTILNALPKQLTGWAARVTAQAAVDDWAELSGLSPIARYERLKGTPFQKRDTAAVRGTRVHALGDAMSNGRDVDVPDDLLGPVQAYARFLDRWQIEPVATETPLVNVQQKVAGTADLWARVGKLDSSAVYLIDLKTGSGVYESVALQLAGYANAELWQPDADTEEAPPEIAGGFVAHVMPDDVALIPVDGVTDPNLWREFLYVKQTWHWLQSLKSDPVIGEALILEEAS